MTKLLFLDVDGVLTDGKVVFGRHEEFRNFNVLDGVGIFMAKGAGLNVVLISGKTCDAVDKRASELGVECHQGVISKLELVNEILKRDGISLHEAAFVGDDLPDLEPMKAVGFPIAVQNAVAEVKQISKAVTSIKGGEGAVREAIELILKKEGKWGEALLSYQRASTRTR
ncbi:MAG: HAD hydrolase family protein [Candidatus Eisenbacteria bacterium]|nr:HAD hydrolase family protein [Candidatus Eisenbacteria bacterium]